MHVRFLVCLHEMTQELLYLHVLPCSELNVGNISCAVSPICVCVYVCVCVRERERERERTFKVNDHQPSSPCPPERTMVVPNTLASYFKGVLSQCQAEKLFFLTNCEIQYHMVPSFIMRPDYQLRFSNVLRLFAFLLIQTDLDNFAIKDLVLYSASNGHNPRNHT